MAENCIKSVHKALGCSVVNAAFFFFFFFPCILESRKLLPVLLAQFLQQNGQIFKDSLFLNHI